MRMIPRHRHHQRPRRPRISISQEEITADLLYPVYPRTARERVAVDLRRRTR
jgi:hypothetical protein